MDWKHNGVQSLLVKPIGTQDLLRQIEALLVQQQDEKRAREIAGLGGSDEVAGQPVQKAS
jgi:hypothetical protein